MTVRPLEGRRILVVEDDYYLAADQKALLERSGAETVGPFGSGREDDALAAAHGADAALVDINLGDGPSFTLARAIRDRGVPFAFVTGYDAAQIPPDLADVPRLEKPARERDLIAMVSGMIGPAA